MRKNKEIDSFVWFQTQQQGCWTPSTSAYPCKTSFSFVNHGDHGDFYFSSFGSMWHDGPHLSLNREPFFTTLSFPNNILTPYLIFRYLNLKKASLAEGPRLLRRPQPVPTVHAERAMQGKYCNIYLIMRENSVFFTVHLSGLRKKTLLCNLSIFLAILFFCDFVLIYFSFFG